jgi:hypothetical protein
MQLLFAIQRVLRWLVADHYSAASRGLTLLPVQRATPRVVALAGTDILFVAPKYFRLAVLGDESSIDCASDEEDILLTFFDLVPLSRRNLSWSL